MPRGPIAAKLRRRTAAAEVALGVHAVDPLAEEGREGAVRRLGRREVRRSIAESRHLRLEHRGREGVASASHVRAERLDRLALRMGLGGGQAPGGALRAPAFRAAGFRIREKEDLRGWLLRHAVAARPCSPGPEALEPRIVCRDVLAKGRRLGVATPRLAAAEPFFQLA